MHRGVGFSWDWGVGLFWATVNRGMGLFSWTTVHRVTRLFSWATVHRGVGLSWTTVQRGVLRYCARVQGAPLFQSMFEGLLGGDQGLWSAGQCRLAAH